MKRNTIVLGALTAFVFIIASGTFTTLPAGYKDGGVLPPVAICETTAHYDVRMDVFMGTGYVSGTKAAEDADVSVPIMMYAMDTRPTADTSLNIARFENTIYYNSTELEFIDVDTVTGGWSTTLQWQDKDAPGDLRKVEVSGVQGNLDMPLNGWLAIYTINFRILCNDQDQIKLDITVNDTECEENNIVLADLGIKEEYDSWGTSQPDFGPDGYAWISEYIIDVWIEDEEVLLGSRSNEVTVYVNEVNYKYDEIEHFLKFDDDMYNCTGLFPDMGSYHFIDSEFAVDGDSIYIHLWNDPPLVPMDEITESTPLYRLEFELKEPSGPGTQDDVVSSVYFNENAPNCLKPYECHNLCGTISQSYAPGSLTIPPYAVDLYLEFDDDYREPGSSAFLDIWIKNNFAAGLPEAGGNIQVLLAYDHRLSYVDVDIEDHHPDLLLDASRINSYDSVSVTLLSDVGYLGFLEPSPDSVFLCRLEFLIDGAVDYDCPDAVGATFQDYYLPSFKTEIIDTTGYIVCTMAPDNGRVTGHDDDFSPWCAKLFAVNVSGGTDVWQQLYLFHDMGIDSVNFNVNWDDIKFCLLNDTYWAPGIYTQAISYPNGLWVRGSSLNLPPGENTLLANLHFGADEWGDVTGTTGFWEPFADFIHVIDEYNVAWYPVTQGGTVTTHLEVFEVSLCPENNHSKVDGTIRPERFALHQNYPNPFNPSTEIAFDIGKFTWVKVEIYNLLGQKIATLVDSPMDAGSYEIEWHTDSDTPSGIYFYTIQADAYSETKKMMLLK